MSVVDITILFVLLLALAENISSGLSNGTTYMNGEEAFQLSKSVEGVAATCPANEIKTIKERTSNSTSVEIITSEDSRCTTTVKKFSADTSRNTSSVVTSGNRIITTTSHIRTLITETASTSVAEMEPTIDTPTVGTMEPSTEELISTTQEEMPLTTPTTSSTASTRVTTGGDLHCLFAADLLNYGFIPYAYERERNFTIKIGEALFERVPMFSAGIWVYGYTRSPSNVVITKETMRSNVAKFREDVDEKVILEDDVVESNTNNSGNRVTARIWTRWKSRSWILSTWTTGRGRWTSSTTCGTTEMSKFWLGLGPDNASRWSALQYRRDCRVRWTHECGAAIARAMEDTTEWNNCESCKLNVTKNAYFETVVAVSLRSKNLSSIIIPPGGKSVGVSLEFTNEDILKVVNTILKN